MGEEEMIKLPKQIGEQLEEWWPWDLEYLNTQVVAVPSTRTGAEHWQETVEIPFTCVILPLSLLVVALIIGYRVDKWKWRKLR